MIGNAHHPVTTTAARLLQRVGGARKTQSVRVERLRAPDSLGLALNTAETPDCDSAPGDSDGDADDCGDVHLGARFQNCGAAWRLATVCKRLGLVAVDSVDGAQAIGGRLAVHVPVIAADHPGGEPSRYAGVVAGFGEAAHSGIHFLAAKRAFIRVIQHALHSHVVCSEVGNVCHVQSGNARAAPLRDGGTGNFEFFSDPGRAPRLRVDPCV